MKRAIASRAFLAAIVVATISVARAQAAEPEPEPESEAEPGSEAEAESEAEGESEAEAEAEAEAESEAEPEPESSPESDPELARPEPVALANPDPELRPFIPDRSQAFAPPPPRLQAPVSYARRSLVLPPDGFAGSLAFLYDSPVAPYTRQEANYAVNLALGIPGNLQLALTFTPPFDGAGHIVTALTFRAVGTQAFQLGLRPELGMAAFVDDTDTNRLVLRPGVAVPIVAHAGNLFRFETGASLSTHLPTDGTPAAAALVTRTVDPSVAGPGVPARFIFNAAQFLFLGLETGFGMLELRDGVDAANGAFMPLQFELGGTVPYDGRPLVDVLAKGGFPYFLLGAESAPTTRLWQVGLTVRAFAPL